MIETDPQPDRFTEVHRPLWGQAHEFIAERLSRPHPGRPDFVAVASRTLIASEDRALVELVYERVDPAIARL
jgi:hypothetical protein